MLSVAPGQPWRHIPASTQVFSTRMCIWGRGTVERTVLMRRGQRKLCRSEKTFMKIVRVIAQAVVWRAEGTGTGYTHCHWSSAALCWPDKGFCVPRSETLSTSWKIWACHKPSPVCKTSLGVSSYCQLDPMKGTHPVTQANSGRPVVYEMPVTPAHPRPHWGLRH